MVGWVISVDGPKSDECLSVCVCCILLPCDDSGTMDELFKRFEKWAQRPLSVSDDEPQFEFALIKNTGKGPSAIIARVNHAIGDGISLARLIP